MSVLRPRRLLALIPLLTATAALAACGGSDEGSGGGGGGASVNANALKGASFTVGSKDFDEQLVLGQIAVQTLEAAGAKVTDKTNIKGTDAARRALTGGDIDLYWEYSGTGWINHLKNSKPIPETKAQFDAVKKEDLAKNQISWITPAPLNNTYALAMKEDKAQQLGITKTSQVADLVNKNSPDATFCIESEFASRDDGFPGLQEKYGFKVDKSKIKTLDTGIVYTELDKGSSCQIGEIFTTDGRVKTLNLRVLEDDKKFFPVYQAAITIKEKKLKENPKLEQVLKPVADKLTTQTITDLNAKVSSDGGDPAKVAGDWLEEQGIVKGN